MPIAWRALPPWGLADRIGVIAAFGMAGAWDVLAIGLFADGAFGKGWNGAALASGVRGLLANDPGQFSAQAAALFALALFASIVSAVTLFPLSLITKARGRPAD